MGLSVSDELLNKLDLDKNSDMSAFLNAKQETQDNLKSIFKLIVENPEKDIAQIMDNLSWNKKTKKIFTKLGVDWEAWTNPQRVGIFKTEIQIDSEREREKLVEDVNIIITLLVNNYPFLALEAEKKGITVKNSIVYLEEQPVDNFNQASKSISLIKKLILSSSHHEVTNLVFSQLVENMPRIAEFLRTLTKNNQEIVIRLADTNDISSIISMGANSACCRALGSAHDEAIPSLITNKMSTAFEIVAEGKVVGSIMVYLAAVNGELALVLGSLETRAIFAENKKISEAVINFAKQFSARIEKPNIPIYMSVVGQDKAIQNFADPRELPPPVAQFLNTYPEEKGYTISPLGSIGKYPIYLSYSLSAKRAWEDLSDHVYLYHLQNPFEQKQFVSSRGKYFSFLNKYWNSLINPSSGIIPGPLALILSEIEKMKANPTIWTEKTAMVHLKNKGVHETNLWYIIQNCKVEGVFDSSLFDLFVKGNQIRPDINFNMMAFNKSFDGHGFNYERYAKIYTIAQKIPYISIGEAFDYVDASMDEVNALLKISYNFPQIDALKIMNLASDTEKFEAGKLNFDKYNKIVSFLEQGISLQAIENFFKVCYTTTEKGTVFNENAFNTIDRIASEAIKRKENFLTVENRKLSNSDIKNFIYLLSPQITAALKICDESTLIAAMGYKMLKFEQFIEAASLLESNFNTRTKESFLQILYPNKSERVRDLETEIKNLKAQFASTSPEDLPALKNQINTYTKELRTLLKQGDYISPQEKIERMTLMSSFNREEELLGLINIMKEKDFHKRNALYNEKLMVLIKDALGGVYNQKLEETLHLASSPYLSNLFASIQQEEFRLKFQEMANMIVHGDFGENLDKTQYNSATQEKFKKYGLDYEKWTHPNQKLSRTFYDGNNLVEIRQVNMRDPSRSLFLGNNSHTCTAVGGYYDIYAIPYIMNTFVGAIEVVVNGKVVGNAMLLPVINRVQVFENGQVVPGSVIKETALLIDDLKITEPYNKYKYLQEVSALAENIAKEIGVPEAKVYISDANVKGYDKLDLGEISKFNLLGNTLDPIWLSAISASAKGGNWEYTGTFVPSHKVK